MDKTASPDHGRQLSPGDIVIWFDHSPIDKSFFLYAVSEQALQFALQEGFLTETEDGFAWQGVTGEEQAVACSALPQVVAVLNTWLSADPSDPRFWTSHYAPMCRHAMAIGQHALKDGRAEVASGVLTRVAVYLNFASRFEDSIKAGTLARDLARKHFGKESEQFAAACVALGNVVAEHENKSKGRKLLNDALRIREALHGRRSLPVADAHYHLGGLCRNQQKFEQSYDHFELCLEIRESLLPPDHLDVAAALDAFGLSHYYLERSQGIDYIERGFEIREKVLPDDHPWLAESLNNMALLLEQSGVQADFESIYRRCLSISEKWYGPLHVEICTHAENLAMLLRSEGRFEEAEDLFHKVIQMEEEMHGPECDLLPTHIHELVECLCGSDRADEAVPWIQRGLSLVRTWPDENDMKLSLLLQFADRCSDVGNEVYAVRVYRELLELLEAHEDPQMKTSVLCHLAMSLAELDEKEDAVSQFELAAGISEREFGRNSQNTLEVLIEYRSLLMKLAQPQKELDITRQIVAITRKVHRSRPAEIAGALHRLSFTLGRNGETAEAEAVLIDALKIYEESLGNNHLHVASVLITLAQAITTANPENALQLLSRALEIQKLHFGEDSTELYEVLHSTAAASVETDDLEGAIRMIRQCLSLRFPDAMASVSGEDIPASDTMNPAESGDDDRSSTLGFALVRLLANAQAALAEQAHEQARSLLKSLIDQL